jgi:ATP-dependent Lhr-like helicase
VKKHQGSPAGSEVKLSACDPLNLSGVILPGPRIPAVPSTLMLFRDGLPVRVITAKGQPSDGENILSLAAGLSAAR